MRRNFPYQRNHVELMPLYNRNYGHSKLSSDGDIALSTHKKIVYLEKEIKSGDTLQSVALEFNVPVSELKRINNIHKDNEIYARNILKVPSNPLTLLLEKEYFTKADSNEENKGPTDSGENTYDVIVESVNKCSCGPRTNDGNAPDEECDENFTYKNIKVFETQDESAALLSGAPDVKARDAMSCNGADWGISWHVLILFTLLLGVGGPVLYVFWYLWGKSHKAEGS